MFQKIIIIKIKICLYAQNKTDNIHMFMFIFTKKFININEKIICNFYNPSIFLILYENYIRS